MTSIAVNPQKTVRQDAALQERSQFLFDKPGYEAIAFQLPRQERFQMACYNTIKNRRFRISRDIRRNTFADGEVRIIGHESEIAGCSFLWRREDRMQVD